MKKQMIWAGSIMLTMCLICSGGIAQAQSVDERIAAIEKRIADLEGKTEEALSIAKGFEFHGYMRSGQGMTNKGGKMENFQPWTGNRFRLGSENDNYVENNFVKNISGSDGSYFKIGTLLAYGDGNERSNWVSRSVAMREAYAECGNLSWTPAGMSFWAGERFYRRHDIHILDYYLLDTSAYGGGFQDLALGGFGKLSVAYLATGSGTQIVDVGEELQNAVDMRVDDIKLPGDFGSVMVQVMPMWRKGGDVTTKNDDGTETIEKWENVSGVRLALFVNPKVGQGGFMGLGNGYTKLTFQYGTGLGTQSGLTGIWPGVGAGATIKDSSAFRVSLSGASEIGEKFSCQPAFVYNLQDNGADSNPKTTEAYAGIRPIYHVNPTLALNFELGAVYRKQDGSDVKGTMYKATFAPAIRPGRSFWARPEIRLFVSVFSWDKNLKPAMPAAFQNDTSGVNLGMQMEGWW